MKTKFDIITIESDEITVEPAQNEHALDLVIQSKKQAIPYSYCQSANGFNHFFSIQENRKQKPGYKTAHHFDWDLTLTNQHVHDWQQAPSPDTCKSYLRPKTIDTLCFILQSGNYVSIITNGTAYRISHVLLQAGLTQQELNKIAIRAAESPQWVVPNFKPEAIRTLAREWTDAKHHYFYDDRDNFCKEVWEMDKEFSKKRKKLHVTKVSLDPNDCSHLALAWNKAAKSAQEVESTEEKMQILRSKSV